MIRGAGRLQRTDTRAQFFTPGEDCVRDGRHLMPQEDWDYFGTEVLTKELMPGGWRVDFERLTRCE